MCKQIHIRQIMPLLVYIVLIYLLAKLSLNLDFDHHSDVVEVSFVWRRMLWRDGYAPAYLQNMARGKYTQCLETKCPLSCPERENLNVVQRINIKRLRWIGHVVHMQEYAPARRDFDAGICGSQRIGRPLSVVRTKSRKQWQNPLIGLLLPI